MGLWYQDWRGLRRRLLDHAVNRLAAAGRDGVVLFDRRGCPIKANENASLVIAAAGGQLDLAGQRYAVRGDSVSARLDLSRTAAGYAVRMRFTAHVAGPCMRCLADADVPVDVDAREVDQPETKDEELRSPYIEGDELDLSSWAHDALTRVGLENDAHGLTHIFFQRYRGDFAIRGSTRRIRPAGAQERSRGRQLHSASNQHGRETGYDRCATRGRIAPQWAAPANPSMPRRMAAVAASDAHKSTVAAAHAPANFPKRSDARDRGRVSK